MCKSYALKNNDRQEEFVGRAEMPGIYGLKTKHESNKENRSSNLYWPLYFVWEISDCNKNSALWCNPTNSLIYIPLYFFEWEMCRNRCVRGSLHRYSIMKEYYMLFQYTVNYKKYSTLKVYGLLHVKGNSKRGENATWNISLLSASTTFLLANSGHPFICYLRSTDDQHISNHNCTKRWIKRILNSHLSTCQLWRIINGCHHYPQATEE